MENGLPQNIQETLACLEKAADGDKAQAQYALAKILISGQYAEKTITRAIALYKASAEQKNQFAAMLLASCI